ncbi:MAG: hypothetical protein KAH20_10020 [Methylococcales bacterium]|nr:hypothetical protein [Methylococcales bacterium]
MQEELEENSEINIDRHPLITIGLLTAGTQIGSKLIQKMGKHPVALFAMGITAGVYTYKNRKEILNEAQHLTKQGKNLFSQSSEIE